MKSLLKDRKTLYITLSIVMVCVFTLTIVYAALNAVLEITGSAEVSAADWNIRLENPVVTSGSVNNNLPVISGNKEASFSVTLNTPGDFYEFTIDVVNNGTIDAMIDSIEMLPELTTNQAKFINYIIEYENGVAISTKQLVEANSFVRLKVKVEFRKDLVASDLPTSQNVLNLSFKLNYVQSDDTNDNVTIDNNGKLIKVVKGDGTNTSDEICIGNECFYVISSTDEEITMLTKYNLLVGNTFNDTNFVVPLENPTGIQDKTAKGWFDGYSVDNPIIGTKPFSSKNYWSRNTSTYPSYVYNENSYLYEYVENYKSHLEGLGAEVNEARLITHEELVALGCRGSNCTSAPSWVYATSYWSGSADSSEYVIFVFSRGDLYISYYSYDEYFGCRPVIVIPRSLI